MPEPWKIIFFDDDDGSLPVEIYLSKQVSGVQNRFRKRLQRLEGTGLGTGLPTMDQLETNLYEMRLEQSPNNPRILFCALFGRNIYLLHGFSKPGRGSAGDKVPESEKRIARNRRTILINREEERKRRETQQKLQEPKPSKAKQKKVKK